LKNYSGLFLAREINPKILPVQSLLPTLAMFRVLNPAPKPLSAAQSLKRQRLPAAKIIPLSAVLIAKAL
jgi:hypothetical protein